MNIFLVGGPWHGTSVECEPGDHVEVEMPTEKEMRAGAKLIRYELKKCIRFVKTEDNLVRRETFRFFVYGELPSRELLNTFIEEHHIHSVNVAEMDFDQFAFLYPEALPL